MTAPAAEEARHLELEGICFDARGQRLLGDLTLAIGRERKTLVLGPNGAGKSLMLRIAHGLLAPTAGRVRDAGARRRRQAMVFERPVLLRRSAQANVVYALALCGVARAERRDRARAALDRTGLLALADRSARVLSAGEQQRLALARAWATEPDLLFLDEPTAPLDPSATRAIEAVIEAIAAAGARIVMTSHDLGQARRLADEVVFLHRGRLLEQTDARSFFSGPASVEAQAYLKGELVW